MLGSLLPYGYPWYLLAESCGEGGLCVLDALRVRY